MRAEPGGQAPYFPFPRWAAAAVVVVVAVGVVLRFVSPADLWLDEAQSVAIARSSLGGIYAGLREDGAPPLYYVLLHVWMAVFGQGTFAVRALSGLFSVAALPVAWALGRRLAGPRTAVALVVLLAANPFAIRYGSETRMYSLIVLEVLLAAAAVVWALRRPGVLPVIAIAASGAALMYTHYWAMYLLAAAACLGVAALWWRRDAAIRVLIGLVLAAMSFLPWVPTLLWQTEHTGTPWAATGGLRSLTSALTAWEGGGDLWGRLLGYTFVVLGVLAVCTVPSGGGRVLGLNRSPGRWALVAMSVGTLAIAGVASLLTSSATVARYSSVALPAFLALVALSITGLPGRRTGGAVLALCVIAGLAASVPDVWAPRTLAGEVADRLRDAAPGDVVAFCPDQLGPPVARLAPARLVLVGYPDLRPVDRVDWTDYQQRNEAADPARVAARLNSLAGDHAIWLVTGQGYRVPSTETCEALGTSLTGLRGTPEERLTPDPDSTEEDGVTVYAAPRV